MSTVEEIIEPKKTLGINWNPKNLTTFSTWIQVASYKIECLDSAIHKNRIIIQQSVITGLVLSTISGSISITQFGNFGENLRFIFNLIFTFMSFNIAFITGYIKTFQIQEKLEEYLQLKQNWIAFSASITAELQLPKELRRDAEIIIAENKEKYLDLFKNDVEVSTADVKRALKKLNLKEKTNELYLPITVKNSRSLSLSNIMLNTVLTQLIIEIEDTNENERQKWLCKEKEEWIKEQNIFLKSTNIEQELPFESITRRHLFRNNLDVSKLEENTEIDKNKENIGITINEEMEKLEENLYNVYSENKETDSAISDNKV
uniref:SMODS and SLOG-associating 2TM effector domain-containing protein n=1 Tax=viral metagenome TaxID=1070528 RepID=A0A6C0EPH7_9ZZZZ